MTKAPLAGYVNVVAIHDMDLERALHRLGIYEELVEGSMNCMLCEGRVNLDNFGALMRINGKIKVICDKPACLSTAIKMGKALREQPI